MEKFRTIKAYQAKRLLQPVFCLYIEGPECLPIEIPERLMYVWFSECQWRYCINFLGRNLLGHFDPSIDRLVVNELYHLLDNRTPYGNITFCLSGKAIEALNRPYLILNQEQQNFIVSVVERVWPLRQSFSSLDQIRVGVAIIQQKLLDPYWEQASKLNGLIRIFNPYLFDISILSFIKSSTVFSPKNRVQTEKNIMLSDVWLFINYLLSAAVYELGYMAPIPLPAQMPGIGVEYTSQGLFYKGGSSGERTAVLHVLKNFKNNNHLLLLSVLLPHSACTALLAVLRRQRLNILVNSALRSEAMAELLRDMDEELKILFKEKLSEYWNIISTIFIHNVAVDYLLWVEQEPGEFIEIYCALCSYIFEKISKGARLEQDHTSWCLSTATFFEKKTGRYAPAKLEAALWLQAVMCGDKNFNPQDYEKHRRCLNQGRLGEIFQNNFVQLALNFFEAQRIRELGVETDSKDQEEKWETLQIENTTSFLL